MKQTQAEDVYHLYDRFIQEFLIDSNSFLTSAKGVCTSESIKSAIKCFIEDYKNDSRSFDEKIIEQFLNASAETKLVFAHAEWLWAFAVDDKRIQTKKDYTKRTTGIKDDAELNNVYPTGFGSAGQWHNQNKYAEIQFIQLVIQFVKEKLIAKEISTLAQVKEWIEKICLFQKYGKEFADFIIPNSLKEALPKSSLAVCNILTYAGNPDNYERIASDNHKWRIYNSFSGLLTQEQREDEQATLDEKIASIRSVLGTLTYPEFDFYEDEYKQVWNYSLTEEGFEEVQGLQYKKAIILYGPPGTSKTHSAKSLANALITNAYLSKKENVVKYFKDEEDIIANRIHRLQLHPNYTYEDFVAGIQLKNQNTEVVKGKLFSICEEALKDKKENPIDDMPHVLILDEINRIDLSRLFGEVFSALENRDEEIEVGVGKLKLSIPRNLYVIGTMNEIDFSLERIDFALRRRFLWFFYGFDRSVLNEIITKKDKEFRTKLKEVEIERFLNNAQQLNNAITKLPELGEQYQIGHTFFGEIVNIYKSFKELNGFTSIQKQLYRDNGAAQILWNISIEPILKAFLGNIDKEMQREKINELKAIYNK
jgi:5-methylcytosine-specific restriction protein B